MLRIPRSVLVCFLAFALAGCDSGEPGRLSLSDYEGPEGEALVRQLVAKMPPLDPAVPKSYCVVKGPRLASTSVKFTERLGDLKLHFVSGESLVLRDPDKMIVDPSSNLPPVTLQISEIKRTGEHSLEAIGGWAYKKIFERHRFKLQVDDKGWAVVASERIEGNYEPAK